VSSPSPPALERVDLGLIDYGQALEAQSERLARRAADRCRDALLICEHPEVVTLGRGSEASDVPPPMAGLPVFEISRGGRATMHLPGQLVVYPILKMEGPRRSLRGLLRVLEGVIIESLDRFCELEAKRISGLTGVWVERAGQPRKIASIGIGVERWVSNHGLAINVSCDLERFGLIRPCGLGAAVMTSVAAERSRSCAERFEMAFKEAAVELFTEQLGLLDAGHYRRPTTAEGSTER
jgi:lipoyl(octanoyl) transferase